jgi:hypothetical protein
MTALDHVLCCFGEKIRDSCGDSYSAGNRDEFAVGKVKKGKRKMKRSAHLCLNTWQKPSSSQSLMP